MFKTLSRLILPNPLDWMLKRAAKKNAKRIVLGWNRGLGDIALGLYAIVERIRVYIPDAEITFLTRDGLKEGFSLLDGVKVVTLPWKRGEKIDVKPEAGKIGYDLLIEAPNPTDWVRWQRGVVTPRLKWNAKHEKLFEKFRLSEKQYVGVQMSAETNYGLWRNWPATRWQEFFDELERRGVAVLLFGMEGKDKIANSNVIDLRGKTTLFELLSIIKNKCFAMVLPDSGISSMVYYLDVEFPIRMVTLWADPNHGILKQAVGSPNKKLVHCPVIAKKKDLSEVSAFEVIGKLWDRKPLQECLKIEDVKPGSLDGTGAILLAGGQGSRLGVKGAKGLFQIEGKSLFEHFFDKCGDGPIAVMTSPANHEETVAFVNSLKRDVYFFQQEERPLLDEKKKETALMGPNGNGNVFKAFVKAGLDKVFEAKGIKKIIVSAIENPLMRGFEPAMSSLLEEGEAVIQCIRREERDRSMGALEVRRGIEVVEYTELDPNEKYKYVYSGQIGFNFRFFCKMSDIDLPIHYVCKKMNGKLFWKGEQFIFDALPLAATVQALEVPREKYYAPIKSLDDVAEVTKILRKR